MEYLIKLRAYGYGNYETESRVSLEEILLQVLGKEYNLPIIKSNNFGHTDKKTVIPIGGPAEINTHEKIKIKLTTPCTQ